MPRVDEITTQIALSSINPMAIIINVKTLSTVVNPQIEF